MITYSAAIEAAIQAGVVMPREFLEIGVKNRNTGAIVYERFWSDVGDLSADVTDPDTGTVQTYTFIGTYGLIEMDAIPRMANMTVPTVTISFAAVGADIDRLVRTYDARQARVRIWRGFLDTNTRRMIESAQPRFYGFVDQVELPTGTEDQEAVAKLICASHSQELTRFSTDTRSNASQIRRSATDDFFADASTIGNHVFFWGVVQGNVPVDPINKLPPGALR